MNLLIALATTAFAKDACPDGLVTLDGVEQTDLASAFAAASSGSTIQVCGGTYEGTFVATVPVNLVAPDGPRRTVLDGGLAGTVLTLPGGSSVTGFTVTGGKSASDGGGLYLSSAGETTLQDCAFTANDAFLGGGAVYAPDGTILHAWDTELTGNTATYGGAMLVGTRVASPRAVPVLGVTVDLDGSVVSGNTARGRASGNQNGWGGGILGYDATILGGEVTGNTAKNAKSGISTWLGMGGGISLVGTSEVHGTRISENTSEGGGGGVHLSSISTVELDAANVRGNEALGANGGGVFATGTVHVYAYDSEIRGNHAVRNGGGVELATRVTWSGGDVLENTATSGGGFFVDSGTHAVEDVLVRGNVATQYGGGAAGNWYHPLFGYKVSFTGCEFIENRAETYTGGALDLAEPTTVTDSVFKGNSAPDGGAMAFYGWYRFSATPMPYKLVNVSIKDNAASASGGAIYATDNAGITLTGGEIKDNAAPAGGGVNLEDGVLTAIGATATDNLPEDVWVPNVATSYTGLGEDFTCTKAGCSAE